MPIRTQDTYLLTNLLTYFRASVDGSSVRGHVVLGAAEPDGPAAAVGTRIDIFTAGGEAVSVLLQDAAQQAQQVRATAKDAGGSGSRPGLGLGCGSVVVCGCKGATRKGATRKATARLHAPPRHGMHANILHAHLAHTCMYHVGVAWAWTRVGRVHPPPNGAPD